MKPRLKATLMATPVVLVAIAGGTYWYVNDRARDFVDMRLDDMVAAGTYDSAEYAELHIGPNGDINMQDLDVVQGPLHYTLQDITVTNVDYTNEFPRHFDLRVNGVRIELPDPNSPDPGTAALGEMLQDMGASGDIPLQLHYNHRYDPDNAHQTDSLIQISVPAYFTLDASSVTRNIQMQELGALNDPDPQIAQQQLLALMQVAEFPSLQMTLQDHGLVDSMLATSAQQNGVSPEDFRRLLVSQLQNLYLFLPPTAQTFAMAAGAEMAEFLEGGKTLSVSMAPEYGGSLQRLQAEVMGAVFTGDYGKVSELLHLEINTR